MGYTENVSTTSNPTQQFYVVSGSRHDALMLCEHLYDEGYGCLLNQMIHRMAHIIRRNMITMMHLLSSKKM